MKLLAAAAAAALLPLTAHANTLDLVPAGDISQPAISYSDGTVTLEVSNVTYQGTSFNAFALDDAGLVVADALFLGDPLPPAFTDDGTGQLVDTATWAFDARINLEEITVEFASNTDGAEELTFTAASGARTVNVSSDGTFALAPLLIEAGESVTVTAAFGAVEDFDFVVLSSIEYSVAPIPVPAALPLAMAGFGGLVGFAKRRRKA